MVTRVTSLHVCNEGRLRRRDIPVGRIIRNPKPAELSYVRGVSIRAAILAKECRFTRAGQDQEAVPATPFAGLEIGQSTDGMPGNRAFPCRATPLRRVQADLDVPSGSRGLQHRILRESFSLRGLSPRPCAHCNHAE